MVGKVGCLVYMVALIVGCLGGSILMADIDGAANKKGQLQVMN